MDRNNTVQEKQPTIFDVAKMANVSVSTVSRVFNGKDRVSEQTREKVQRVMDKLNYVPSNIATSMITGKTKMILVMVPDFQNPYFSQVMCGIEAELRANEYYAVFCHTIISHRGSIVKFRQNLIRWWMASSPFQIRICSSTRIGISRALL